MKNQKAVETLEIQNKTEHPININFQSLNNSQHTHTLESLPVCFWLHISPSPCFLTANNENEASPHASSCFSSSSPTHLGCRPSCFFSCFISRYSFHSTLSLSLSSFGYSKLLFFSYDSFPFWILTTKLLKQGRSSITGIIKW